MPVATIFAPREGDVLRPSNVTILSSFAGFSPGQTLTCQIGAFADAPHTPATSSGYHSGTTSTIVPVGTYTVQVKIAQTVLAEELNVVVSDTPPVVIDPQMEFFKSNKTIHAINVTVTNQPTASYVVVQVFEIDTTLGHIALLAAGAETIEEKAVEKKAVKVRVQLDVNVRPDKTLVYLSRAFIYNREMRLLASTSQLLTKPKQKE